MHASFENGILWPLRKAGRIPKAIDTTLIVLISTSVNQYSNSVNFGVLEKHFKLIKKRLQNWMMKT